MIDKTAGCFCGEHKFNVLLDEKPKENGERPIPPSNVVRCINERRFIYF